MLVVDWRRSARRKYKDIEAELVLVNAWSATVGALEIYRVEETV